jgi:uncharacterized protein YmfQ (DUF2313 family)
VSHDQVLNLLFPIELGGSYPADLQIEAQSLDTAQANAETLNQEMFPYSTYNLLGQWEKTYGIAVNPDDTLQLRRSRVMQKMSELGQLNIPYFIQLALSLGFVITIEELKPLMAGWMQAGDEVMSVNVDGTSNSDWCWTVNVISGAGIWFRSGESCSGEPLFSPLSDVLEPIFNDLKPADTFVDFVYL